MKESYNQIQYHYRLVNGQKIEGISDNFESMVLSFRKKLKANKVNRAESKSLRYKFTHELDFSAA